MTNIKTEALERLVPMHRMQGDRIPADGVSIVPDLLSDQRDYDIAALMQLGLKGIIAEFSINTSDDSKLAEFALGFDRKGNTRVVSAERRNWHPLLLKGGSLSLGQTQRGESGGAHLQRTMDGDIRLIPASTEEDVRLTAQVYGRRNAPRAYQADTL
jgi:hypothetical protein